MREADQLVEPLSLHTIQLRSEFSDDAVAELQAEDSEIGKAYEAMSENVDPSTDEIRALPLESRRLLSMQPEVRLQGSLVVKQRDGRVQVVVPVSLRRRLFEITHNAAHLGSRRTYQQLSSSYSLMSTMSTLCQRQRTTTSSTWSTTEDTGWCSNGFGHHGHSLGLTHS